MFNYRLKQTLQTFPVLESYGVFKTNQLAKATSAEIVLCVTGRQTLYWLVFVMQCTLDFGLSGKQANQNSVGGGKKTESRWDVPRRQPLLHPSNNDQHFHFRKLWMNTSPLTGWTDRVSS